MEAGIVQKLRDQAIEVMRRKETRVANVPEFKQGTPLYIDQVGGE